MGYEQIIMGLYVHNVVVALPLTILIIKLLVRFVTREPAKDVFRSILDLPLDLVYVALGLLLAGMARRIPTFVSHYQNDKEADFAGIVLCLVVSRGVLNHLDGQRCPIAMAKILCRVESW